MVMERQEKKLENRGLFPPISVTIIINLPGGAVDAFVVGF
jgi:hypothetical protein